MAGPMVDARKVAGTYLFVGVAQFVVGMMIAEAVYPDYSISGNFISDLGVGPAAPIFNASVALLGVFVLAAAYFLRKSFLPRTAWGMIVTVFFLLAGAGAVGVGIFTEEAGAIHTVVSLVTFLFGALAAIATFTLVGPPLRYLSLVLGIRLGEQFLVSVHLRQLAALPADEELLPPQLVRCHELAAVDGAEEMVEGIHRLT